jgi:redox-regulated HSP33 family molecular chaperone
MNDYMLRIMCKEAGLRGLACITTELAREAAHRHRAAPVAAAALSDGLTAAALLGAQLKVLGEDDLLALIVEGEAVVHCHFCHERYVFEREELGEILDEIETERLKAMFESDEP